MSSWLSLLKEKFSNLKYDNCSRSAPEAVSIPPSAMDASFHASQKAAGALLCVLRVSVRSVFLICERLDVSHGWDLL